MSSRVVFFKDHVLHVQARQLFRGSTAIHLSPKVMDLLLYLVANAARYVPKDELTRALWPDVRVGPASLPSLVKELRRALSDTAAEPVLVRTLHGRGYQFAAELRYVEPLPAPAAHARVSPEVDTALSLPPDFQADGSALGVVTLWPPRGPCLRFPLEGALRLGRAESSDLFLPYEKVSRSHAEIARKGPVFVLRDLGSTNGCFVDGERVREGAVLRRGQLVRLGEWLGLLSEADEEPAPELVRLVSSRDWSGQVRELDAACRERLDLLERAARPAARARAPRRARP